MSERYKVVDGSQTGDVNVDATVVDTTRPWTVAADLDAGLFEPVCGCMHREDAETIAKALNASVRPPRVPDDGSHRPSDDIAEVREALDDSQSLFMALLLVGPNPEDWKTEGMVGLIEQQAAENRRVLGPPGA